MRKYDQSSLDPAAEIVGRRTLSSLVFGAVFGAALGAAAGTPGAVCVPAEWTESKTALERVCHFFRFEGAFRERALVFLRHSLWSDLVCCDSLSLR